MRALSLAAIGAVILAAAFMAPSALAGTADQPEISDINDGTRDSRDITAVWFDDETNMSLSATMNLTALESFTSFSDLANLPNTEYEVYFSIGEKNYSIVCRVPVHGPVGLTIQWDVRSVVYDSNGTGNPTETSLGTGGISGTYNVGTHLIVYTVDKNTLGDPKAGAHLAKTWAAVWNKDRGQAERSLEDRAPNAGYGRDYIVRGSAGAEVIDVQLTASNSTLKVSPSEPAKFAVTVLNNGTSPVSLELYNSTPSLTGWTCELSLVNMTLSTNSSRVAYVTLSCARNAKLNVTGSVTIWAVVHVGNQNSTSKSLLLSAVVDYIPPKTASSSNPFTAFINWIKAHPKDFAMYLIVIIVVVAAVSVAAIFVRRSSRKKRELSAQAPART